MENVVVILRNTVNGHCCGIEAANHLDYPTLFTIITSKKKKRGSIMLTMIYVCVCITFKEAFPSDLVGHNETCDIKRENVIALKTSPKTELT